jgi:integrase
MARTARNAKLDTRSARAKLVIRREPYWCNLGGGLAVGYRRIDRNYGTWIARAYDGTDASGKAVRRYQALGLADDTREADGVDVLTFAQAQAIAREWFPRAFLARYAHDKIAKIDKTAGDGEAVSGDYAVSDSPNSSDSPPRTVAEAVAGYAAWLKLHKKATTARQAAYQAETIKAAPIGAVRLDRLTAGHLRQWRDRMAEAPARHRTAKPDESPEQTRRKRQSTTNRALTTLRAALRHAEASYPGTVPGKPWEGAKPFKNVDSARVRWLSVDECRRLLNAAPPDLRRLVRAALLSGCRYGELCRLRCGDFHPESGTLHIAEAKAGARTIPLDDEARAFFDSITAGRAPSETMLLKANGKPWGADHQKRPMALASEAARLDPPATLHCLRHTFASLRIMAGAPLPAIAAALGHSGNRMVERHYGHLAPSWVADAIKATALGIGAGDEAEKIERLTA